MISASRQSLPRDEAGRAGHWLDLGLAQIIVLVDVHQPPDLQGLGGPEEGPQLVLGHVDLALVHVLDNILELGPTDVAKYDDRMLEF